MRVQVIEDAKVLMPHKEHQNFIETGETIEKGTILEGKEQPINGLRRGEPFTYKLFIAKNGKIIFLNKIKAMNNVEVLLNADGKNIVVGNTNNDKVLKIVSTIAFGYAAFELSKRKKFNSQQKAIAVVTGLGLGYFLGSVAVKYQSKVK